MAERVEVLVGSLNLRDVPGGRILTTLSKATQLEATPPEIVVDGESWLKVTAPNGVAGVVCAKYVGRVAVAGQQGPQATHTRDVSSDRLLALAPTAKRWIADALAERFDEVATPFGITETPRRLCHFLAQAAHESAGFRTLEEYGGPTYWRRYDGRADLGNNQPGDGARYHGRGIFQLTGRANYRSMGQRINQDLEENPDAASLGDVSLRTACEYWRQRGLQRHADANDIREVTRRINGGLLGFAERQAYFRRAWSIWGTAGEAAGI